MRQHVPLPKSSESKKFEQLLYFEQTDDAASKTYAFLAYKETDVKTGKWVVRMTGNATPGTTFDPAQMEKQAQKAEANGKEFFVWGFNMQPKKNDSRLVETRVYQSGGKPTRVEVHLVLRKADGSAKAEKVGKFKWPA